MLPPATPTAALAAHVTALKQLLADTLRGSFLLPVDTIRAAFARDGGLHPALFLPACEGGPADSTWHSMDLLRLLGSLLERPVLLGAVSDAVEYAGLVSASCADDDDGSAISRSPSSLPALSGRSSVCVDDSDARSSDRSASDGLARRLPHGIDSPRVSLPSNELAAASSAHLAASALPSANDDGAQLHAYRAHLEAIAAERQRERAQSEADARQCAERIDE